MIFQEDSFPEDLPSFSLNNTDLRRLCAREASRFSYSKSTWTFPLYKKISQLTKQDDGETLGDDGLI